MNEIGEDGNTRNRRHIGRLAFYAGADPPILQPDRWSAERALYAQRRDGARPAHDVVHHDLRRHSATADSSRCPESSGPVTFPGAPVSGAGGGSLPPRTTSPTTAPEPEGRIARLWNAATEWLDSWFADKWLPFIQGPGDTFSRTPAGQKLCCIHPNDVIQGWHNDCFGLSALAAIAMVSPGGFGTRSTTTATASTR